jgi:hypothetical protein
MTTAKIILLGACIAALTLWAFLCDLTCLRRDADEANRNPDDLLP